LDVADAEALEIQVDTEVRVRTAPVPRKVLDALRRQLRQLDLAPGTGADRRILSLMQTREGRLRMPQALLSRVTETCRRHGVPYSVIDRRAMVACPPMRSRVELDEDEREAIRRLLVRDSGVVVVPDEERQQAIASDFAARRQQRTLVAVESEEAVERWLEALRGGLDLPSRHVQGPARGSPDAWVVVTTYDELAELPPQALQEDYGMVVLAGLTAVDALTVMRTIRAAGARYLLGVASAPLRDDRLHNNLFAALGGIVHQLAPPAEDVPAIRLGCRFQVTAFEFPYEGRRQYQALLAALAADEARCQRIGRDVAAEASAGQPCLVLSERRDHLDRLAAALPASLAHETITSAIRPAERERILARFASGAVSVLLATSQIAAEGIASPAIQRVFLTFPFSYTRKLDRIVDALLQPSPDQQDAIVFDYDDAAVAPLHRAFEKRRQFLLQLQREHDRVVQEQRQLELPLG
jgi:superfamily II DNA or RNA helicase